MTQAVSKRRWFQFSLRTMFVVVALAAIPLGWLGYYANWARQRRDARVWIEKRGPYPSAPMQAVGRPRIPWALRLMGEDNLYPFIIHPNFDDARDLPAFEAQLESVRRLFPESDIYEGEPWSAWWGVR